MLKFKFIDKINAGVGKIGKNSQSGVFMQAFFGLILNENGWETFKIGMFENEKMIGGTVAISSIF